MRSVLLVLLTTLLLLGLVAGSCGGGISGRYVNEDEPTVSVLIMEDGTYELREEGRETTKGVWEVEGDTLILDKIFEFQIWENKLVLMGQFWVKE